MKRDLLSTRKVQNAKSDGKYGGYLADGGGLYLQISAYGTKSWVFRYTRHGKQHEMGLGRESDFSLKEARERAKRCRQLLADGIDPLAAKQAKRDEERAKEAARITFEDAAKQYIKAHAPSWKNAKHRQQWPNSLAAYVYPVIGKLPVDQVDLPHVLKILEPIWLEKTETASRVRARIEKVLSWATARKYRTGDNPARWTCLDTLLPAKAKVSKVKHYEALPWIEMPAFMADLRDQASVSARALEFCILTATRTSETLEAPWKEFDLKNKVWTIPAERMKNERDYRVPLCARAMEILNDRASSGSGSDFVFANGSGKPLPDGVMLNLLRSMRPNGYTVHGFRSTLSSWARARTNYPRDVVEMALAHAIKDKTEAAYMHDDLIEKRTGLMREWCKYCSSTPLADGAVNVVSIRA
jgi:integrase